MQQAESAGEWQQGQGDAQQQANGYWQQGQQYDPQYSQQYVQYDQYGQPFYPDQEYYAEQQQAYDMSQWQQQQRQPAEAGGEGEQASASAAVAVEGWSGEHDGYRAATWGSPDTEMLESGPAATEAHAATAAAAAAEHYQQQQQPLQQQESYSAAAADEVAGGWDADDAALDLQLGVVVPEPQATAAAASEGPAGYHELHAADVIEAARAARISTSSLGLESQPSTGRVAAAAARRIVTNALENILLEHAVPEDAEQETAAAAGAADWAGAEAEADGWAGAELDLGEDLAAAGKDPGLLCNPADRGCCLCVWLQLAPSCACGGDQTCACCPCCVLGGTACVCKSEEEMATSVCGKLCLWQQLVLLMQRTQPDQPCMSSCLGAEFAADDDAAAEGEDAAVAPVSAAWSKLAQQFNAAADAAASMGAMNPDLETYQAYFVQYGEYLLGALPRPALEQAGLLAPESADSHADAGTAAGATAAAEVEEQQEEDEEDEEMWAEFGNLQLKDETTASMFAVLGFDTASLLACMGEA
jgi:hypothetical protein